MLTAAVKLDDELLAALNKLYYTRELEQKAKEELYQALNRTFNAYINASTQLLRLEKVCKKVQSKEYYLVK